MPVTPCLVLAWQSQPAGNGAGQETPAIHAEVDLVVVETTVKDKAGRVMKDLKQEDFVLFEDSVPHPIIHFSRDELPLAVAVVVDLSGSIQPFLQPLRYATLTSLRALKPEDRVALFTFSNDVELLAELTEDKRAASDQMETLTSAAGGTNINDALFLAAEYLRKEAPKTRRVIVLISDDVPTVPGVARPDRVLEEILKADAVLYNIKVPGHNPLGARMMAVGHGFVNVRRITAEAGGEVIEVEKEGSLYLAFQTVIDRLKTRYTLGYSPTNLAHDGRFRALELKLQPRWGKKGSDYTILSRRGYYATLPARSGH
jgi:VWFA-related protein